MFSFDSEMLASFWCSGRLVARGGCYDVPIYRNSFEGGALAGSFIVFSDSQVDHLPWATCGVVGA